jgi:hypothetical protein
LGGKDTKRNEEASLRNSGWVASRRRRGEQREERGGGDRGRSAEEGRKGREEEKCMRYSGGSVRAVVPEK